MGRHNPDFEALVDKYRQDVLETNCRSVFERLEAGERLNLIDVRESSEYERGSLPGAVFLSKGVIERDIGGAFPNKNEELILFCGGGYRSVLAAKNLQEMGYKNVVSMDGGWRDWNAHGFPVEGSE